MEEAVRGGLSFGEYDQGRGPLVMDSSLVQTFLKRLQNRGEGAYDEKLAELAWAIQGEKPLQALLHSMLEADASIIRTVDDLDGLTRAYREYDLTGLSQFRLHPYQAGVALGKQAAQSPKVQAIIKGIDEGLTAFFQQLWDTLVFLKDIVADEKTRSQVLDMMGDAAIVMLKLVFGPPSMKAEAIEQIYNLLAKVVETIASDLMKQWQEADTAEKRTQLIAKWSTMFVLEIVTSFLMAAKGAKAAKIAKEFGETVVTTGTKAAREAFEKGVEKAKNLGRKGAAGEAQEAAEKQAVKAVEKEIAGETAELSEEAIAELGKKQTSELADAKRLSQKKTQLTKAEIGNIHRAIGSKAAKILKNAPADTRGVIHRSLLRFMNSTTARTGSINGAEFLAKHPRTGLAYVKKAIRAVESIKSGKGITVYTTLPSRYVSEAIEYGMKGPTFDKFRLKNLGKDNRFGTGKYFSVDEHKTSRLEVFTTSEYDHLGNLISKRGTVPEGYSIMKATFKPTDGIGGDFIIAPSVRRPRGLNLIDLDNANWGNFVDVEEVWNVPKGSL